jgi:AbrB family looped-hinge helix DNA binding protein
MTDSLEMNKRYIVVMDSRCRVTVPLEIRAQLGLAPGDKVEFTTAGKLKYTRIRKFDPNPFEKYKGILGAFPRGEKGTKAWSREIRGR